MPGNVMTLIFYMSIVDTFLLILQLLYQITKLTLKWPKVVA